MKLYFYGSRLRNVQIGYILQTEKFLPEKKLRDVKQFVKMLLQKSTRSKKITFWKGIIPRQVMASLSVSKLIYKKVRRSEPFKLKSNFLLIKLLLKKIFLLSNKL